MADKRDTTKYQLERVNDCLGESWILHRPDGTRYSGDRTPDGVAWAWRMGGISTREAEAICTELGFETPAIIR